MNGSTQKGTEPSSDLKKRPAIGVRTFSFLLVVLLAIAAASCGAPAAERDPGPEDDINPNQAGEQGDSAGSEREASIRQLSNDAGNFYGERVAVSSTVARVVQPEVFTLVSDEPESDEEPVEDKSVLVVSSEPVASGLSAEDSVRVSGKVRPFKLQEIEQELGTELRDSLRADYSGQTPAILAESVSSIQ